MSPLRIIGYVGIALLGMLCIFIFWMSLINGELKGLLVSAGFLLLLAFFAYGLRNEIVENTLGISGVPFSFREFLYGVMLKSIEGWLVLVCAGVCLLNILLMIPNWSWSSFLLWIIYPWLPFAVWIRWSGFTIPSEAGISNRAINIALLGYLLFIPAKSLWQLLTGSDSTP